MKGELCVEEQTSARLRGLRGMARPFWGVWSIRPRECARPLTRAPLPRPMTPKRQRHDYLTVSSPPRSARARPRMATR